MFNPEESDWLNMGLLRKRSGGVSEGIACMTTEGLTTLCEFLAGLKVYGLINGAVTEELTPTAWSVR